MELNIKEKFDTYPKEVKEILLKVRGAIFEVANEQKIPDLQETLKWGEPSYLTKLGSTVRYDWKQKTPNQISIYFNCNTSLVETFKEIYCDELTFEGNRAIVFNFNDTIPWPELKHCIGLSLRYHTLKNALYWESKLPFKI